MCTVIQCEQLLNDNHYKLIREHSLNTSTCMCVKRMRGEHEGTEKLQRAEGCMSKIYKASVILIAGMEKMLAQNGAHAKCKSISSHTPFSVFNEHSLSHTEI